MSPMRVVVAALAIATCVPFGEGAGRVYGFGDRAGS
jgi:hypothetical protein